MNPRYPVYVPSKGRVENCLTPQFLIKDNVPFKLIVEPQEQEAYSARFGAERVLALPFSNLGLGSIPARNWIKGHATALGAERHWQLDDNIRHISRRWNTKRIICPAGTALAAVEDFVDRYENVAIAGLAYEMFTLDNKKYSPFQLNCHVYSCMLMRTDLPYEWRGRYNEDTDYCLQVLADGWCTVLFNAFMIKKLPTMLLPGGNTTDLYQGDGRLKMARALERQWPGVVETKRRYNRPQHVIKNAWQRFDTPLKLKEGVSLADFAPVNEYGMQLKQVKPEIKSQELKTLFDKANTSNKGETKT